VLHFAEIIGDARLPAKVDGSRSFLHSRTSADVGLALMCWIFRLDGEVIV